MFSDPRFNIDQFRLDPGMVVADLGSGSGHYTFAIAKAVAPTGRVYAVDVQKDLLVRLKAEATRLHVGGVEIIVGDLEHLGGTKIREASVDRVIASNILFMIEHKKDFVSEIKRILKKGGKVLIIDWSSSFGHMGPHPDQVVYKEQMMKLCTDAGFVYDREINAGDHHYGLIFRQS
jgi:arsenite methyltransferase